MKKILIALITGCTLCSAVTQANAHGWNGGGHGGWRGGWAPFATGAIVGAVAVNAYRPYNRPYNVYYVQPPVYYNPVVQNTAAYCPENGLYYPQTQACPSGWQQVPVN